MREPPDVPPEPQASAAPAGPGTPLHARFDGILDGRLGDVSAIRCAVADGNRAGYGAMDLEVDGGRFSILMDAGFVPAARMTDDGRRAFVEALNRVSAASAAPVESTLRVTEVFQDVVRETLFVAEGGQIRPLTRERPANDADRGGPARPEPELPPMSRGRIAILAGLLLLAAALIGWFGGWIDRAFSRAPQELTVETGPFGNMLAATVEGSWGDYVVTLRRGPGYPRTNERIEEMRRAAETPADRAAVEAVVTGSEVWLRLELADGRAVQAGATKLRPLVEREDGTIEKTLPGRIGAARIRFALDAGAEFR